MPLGDKNNDNIHWNSSQISFFPPYEPNIVFVFQGLLGFCYNKNAKQCLIGVHSEGAVDNSKGKVHKLNIKVRKNSPDGEVIFPQGNIHYDDIKVISLKLHKSKINNTYFYIGTHSNRDEMIRAQDRDPDPKDFRWIIDMEDLYRKKLKKNSDIYNISLAIKDAIFYCSELSAFKFKLHKPGTPTDDDIILGNVACSIGANIYVERDGGAALTLQFNDQTITWELYNKEETRYVCFSNDCSHWQDSKACDDYYKPNSDIVEERNDFYLNYRAFDVPAGGIYELIPHSRPASDMAPCAGISYGMSENLDT